MSEPDLTSVSRFGTGGARLLAALHAHCFETPWGEAEMLRLLDSTGVEGLVLQCGDDPVGLALVRAIAGEAEILTLGIAPDHRQKGLGLSLVRACAERARSRAAERLYLEVSEANLAAQALYESAGFSKVGYRPRYYRDGNAALVLAMTL